MAENTTKHVLIVAGEASGDLHGSNLARAMMELNPGVHMQGIGGRKMEAAGVDILIPSSDMAVVGLTEVLSRLSSIIKAYLKLRSLLKNSRTDLLILIDYPDFNINLARTAKHFGVPVLYYISPQVWAWRSGRVRKIARRVNRMAVILPFEKDFYLKTGTKMDVEYVGHPLLDAIPHDLDKLRIKQELGIKDGNPILGILPGSRNEEIRNLLPLMISAAESLLSRYNNLRCVLPVAPTISTELVQSLINKSSLEVLVSPRDIYSTLSVCDLALVASGTATLETAIMEVPMVIAYRVSSISAWIGKIAINVPYVGLVNIIAGEEVVPELLQDEVTPQGLADKALSILENEDKKRAMVKKLRMIKARLGSRGASQRTAKIAMQMMERN
ncbi:lipid-A-disaccharide synthase [Thermodesulfobacteriota bacterium]